MGVTPPTECMYALGHYRPGNCAPYMINPVPLSCRGAALEAGAVAGAIWFSKRLLTINRTTRHGQASAQR
jgi:hypothetical protein